MVLTYNTHLEDQDLTPHLHSIIWGCLIFLKIFPSPTIQNKNKILYVGVFVQKIHKLKLCLINTSLRNFMICELLYRSIRNSNDGTLMIAADRQLS